MDRFAIAFYSIDDGGFVGVETFQAYDDADVVYEDWCDQLPHALMEILPISECVKIKWGSYGSAGRNYA